MIQVMIDRVFEGPGQHLSPLEVDRNELRARIDVAEAGHEEQAGRRPDDPWAADVRAAGVGSPG